MKLQKLLLLFIVLQLTGLLYAQDTNIQVDGCFKLAYSKTIFGDYGHFLQLPENQSSFLTDKFIEKINDSLFVVKNEAELFYCGRTFYKSYMPLYKFNTFSDTTLDVSIDKNANSFYNIPNIKFVYIGWWDGQFSNFPYHIRRIEDKIYEEYYDPKKEILISNLAFSLNSKDTVNVLLNPGVGLDQSQYWTYKRVFLGEESLIIDNQKQECYKFAKYFTSDFENPTFEFFHKETMVLLREESKYGDFNLPYVLQAKIFKYY